MIKKKIFLSLLLIIMVSTCVFANTVIENENKASIVSVSSSQVTAGSEFYLILNLANISFSKFKVDIVNTASLPMDELTSEVSSLSTNEVATSFIVEKSLINLDKLGIVFTAPIEPSKVKFEITITSLDVTVESLKEDLEIKKEELSQYEEQLKKYKEQVEKSEDQLEESTEQLNLATLKEDIIKIEGLIAAKANEISELENQIFDFEAENIKADLTVDIIEQQNNIGKENLEKEEFDKEEIQKEFEKEMDKSQKEMNEMNDKMKDMQKNLDNAQSTISSLTKNVTYQGSRE